MTSIDFHAHHSPQGAYATFTCGRFGAGGGLASCNGAWQVPQQDIVVGWLDPDGTLHQLPFSKGAAYDAANYASSRTQQAAKREILSVGLRREYSAATDAWTVGPLGFRIFTPVHPLPDPAIAGEASLQALLLPAVCAELELDNRDGDSERTLVFAIAPGCTAYRLDAQLGDGAVGVSWDRRLGVASPTPGAESWVHWSEVDWHRERRSVYLGMWCGISLTVPAGERRTLRLVMGFHEAGPVTTGIEARCYYARHHASLASVLTAGFVAFDARRAAAASQDAELLASGLSPDRQFLLAHAQRSYWGSAHLLDVGGTPTWAVYEGEYSMINTFDLSVDQCFYELRRNPWLLRSVLDQFADRYHYRDRLARPPAGAVIERGEEMERDSTKLHELVPPPIETDLPGGVSFCHDMGVQLHFMPAGDSSYECSSLTGCFSFMTAEQLANFCCTAATYVLGSGDAAWADRRLGLLKECLDSLDNRDDPVPERRNGLVSLDSSRCAGGWEITTYDSLDPSLGQARENLYVAVKWWASYLGLERLFRDRGEIALAVRAADGARRVAAAIVKRLDPATGIIPAVLDGHNRSAIIPAVEGVVFPWVWRLSEALDRKGPYADLLAALERHLRAILVPGLCRCDDGGWKLSSTAANTWMSKIFLCQTVAERVFGLAPDAAADAAHVQWQAEGSASWAFCDQIKHGKAIGSKYYPRGVTCDLWLS